MNAIQETKLGMFQVVHAGLEERSDLISSIPALKLACARFKIVLTSISITAQQEDLVISGVALDKTMVKKKLVLMGADTAAIIFSYAVEINDQALMQEVNYSLSALQKTKDDQLPIRLKNIYDKGMANLDALDTFGISPELLATFNELIDTYRDKVPNPRRALSTKKTVKANLVSLFKEADSILKLQIDKRIVALKNDHPDFVAEYKSNRILVDAAKTTTQFKGTVTRKSDGANVANATVKIDNTVYQTVTDENGAFLIKGIPYANYTATVTFNGLEAIEAAPVQIKRGQINKMKFILLPEAD